MISNAFRGAVENEVAQQNQGINTITTGIKDTATAILGGLGFAGKLGSGMLAKASKHALANKVGGIGGNLMLASMEEKKVSVQENKAFTAEEVTETIRSQLGDNPINRSAMKQLGTVFEKLQEAKEEKIINEKGQIDTSFGEVDPNSPLGKKIMEGFSATNDSQKKKTITKDLKVSDPTLTISEEELNKKSSYFREEESSIEDRVKKRSGTTYSWKETGYITPDGSRIDLSGKNQGAPGGSRNVDHRDIFEEEDFAGDDSDGTTAMIEFMKRGNIRVNPEYPGINLQKEPTKEQYELIQSMAERLGWNEGYFAIDIDNEKGDVIESLTYESPIKSRKIIEDLKYYFKEGKAPYKSDLQKFTGGNE